MKFKILILAFLFVSCGAKKTITKTVEVIKNDTIVLTKDRIITKAINDTIVIESPCDSLGILKPFKQRLKTERGSIIIESKNNGIEARINLDSIVQSIEKEYKSKYVDKKQNNTVEVVRYKTPLWLILTALFSIALNLVQFKARF